MENSLLEYQWGARWPLRSLISWAHTMGPGKHPGCESVPPELCLGKISAGLLQNALCRTPNPGMVSWAGRGWHALNLLVP